MWLKMGALSFLGHQTNTQILNIKAAMDNHTAAFLFPAGIFLQPRNCTLLPGCV